ncbi:hypothetical protein C7H10_14215 [Marinobacter shengliensis]|nr:hypothetical protein C7H10_14215 [Marinobacter shengliensis]
MEFGSYCSLIVWRGEPSAWPPKKRYELVPERFAPAIHGLRDFWEAMPTARDRIGQYRNQRGRELYRTRPGWKSDSYWWRGQAEFNVDLTTFIY